MIILIFLDECKAAEIAEFRIHEGQVEGLCIDLIGGHYNGDFDGEQVVGRRHGKEIDEVSR